MGKVIRLNEARLRMLIAEELDEVGGAVDARSSSLKKFKESLKVAMQALIELYQSANGEEAHKQASELASGLKRVIRGVDTMSALTGSGAGSPPAGKPRAAPAAFSNVR